ncbi:ABC transporter ATP-binding protein [Thermodesulfobacteriota bacterium]
MFSFSACQKTRYYHFQEDTRHQTTDKREALMSAASNPVITIKGLTIEYHMQGGFFTREKHSIRVINNLDLQIFTGETIGIVGESGCGKSTLAHGICRLVEPTGGEIIFKGTDILKLNKPELRGIRPNIQLVFQDPFSSLNPRMNILELVAEPLRTHSNLSSNEIGRQVEDLLTKVGVGSELMNRYPHQLSGGQAQRVILARALSLNPSFIILDEPTSALDVSVQAQIINLLIQLQKAYNLSYLFISHDLTLVQHIATRIGVIYLGEIVELSASEVLFEAPQHPYTQALLSATPLPDPDQKGKRIVLEGNVPSPANPPPGCRFHVRCPHVMDICRIQPPGLHQTHTGWAKCHLLRI